MAEEHRHACGHTDEDHEGQLRYLMQQLALGDISVLVPRLSNENLELVLQAAVVELMVRSQTMDGAAENWHNFNTLVHAVYLVPDAESSASPEHWLDIKRGQEDFNRDVEQYDFQTAVEQGLQKLFEEGLDESL